MKARSPLLLLTALAAPTVASAQLTVIASESFDYSWPGLLDGQNGGGGWTGAWVQGPGSNGIVIQANPPTNPGNPFPWPQADSIGNYAQQAIEYQTAERTPDQTGHGDVIENGEFGRDGTTMWISVTMWNIQQFGTHFGSVSFMSTTQGTEQWLLGSPWSTDAWGIDTCPGFGCIYTVPNTSDQVSARLVTRIDYVPGQDRVRIWVNPAQTHPTGTANLDTLVDIPGWDQIRLWSGGSASLYYWDNLVIEKGVPIPASGFCYGDGSGGTCPCGNTAGSDEGCANSTGNGAAAVPTGSTSVAADDFGIACTNLLPNQPALLFVGDNAINNGDGLAFGDGLRCAGGSVIRLGVKQPNSGGMASWGPGLGATGGWGVSDTKRFQVWYRDPTNSACGFGFNLSNGVQVTFTL